MDETPFAFAWGVDQAGYKIERTPVGPEVAELLGREEFEYVIPRGGPIRYYLPLDDESLWLRFAQDCKDADSILSFANEFGPLGEGLEYVNNRVDSILETASIIQRIAERLHADERRAAAELLNSDLPTMKAGIIWDAAQPEPFGYRLFPVSLRDALLHQAGEAITGNRRFRRCRNEGCPNWFRIGARPMTQQGRRQTITARREFCSDRCRVASARKSKDEVIHA